MNPLYPFQSRYLDLGGVRMHYLDEGAGPPVVMLHGNPTWSFFYRNLVLGLRDRMRCIVPDQVGCGLSDKPPPSRYPYSMERRVDDLGRILEHASIGEPFTMVVHDWGGMIGLAWAVRHPERIRRLVILNTAAFHPPAGKALPWQLRLVRRPVFGPLLVQGFNAFCRGAARRCVVRRPLPPDVRAMYLMPYDSWGNRIAVLKFVQTIPFDRDDPGYSILTSVEKGLEELRDVPMLICWGMRDFVFDKDYLNEWTRRFPQAEVVRFDDAGHYVLDDAGDEILARVRKFLAPCPAVTVGPGQ